MNVWMVGDSASRFSASPGGDERRTATDSRAATVAGGRGRSGAICLGSHSCEKVTAAAAPGDYNGSKQKILNSISQ